MNKSVLIIIFSFLALDSLFAFKKDDNRAVYDSLYQEAYKEMYGDPQRVVNLFHKAFMLKNIDVRRRADFYLLYAMAERMQGDFDGCIKTLATAEDMLNSISSEERLLRGRIYNEMSICYCTLTDYSTAIRLNDQAMAIFKAENDSFCLASVYNTRGIIHAYLNEFPQADKFLKQALEINRKRKDLKQIAANLNNLCLFKGDFQEKMAYIKEAIVLNKNLNAKWALAENYNNMGRQYYFVGEYSKALDVLKEAFDMATSIDAKGLLCDNYEYCSWVYYAMGRYKEAYEKQTLLFSMSQELQSVNELWALERSITQKRMSDQQQKAKLNQQKIENRLLFSYLLTSMIVAVFLIVLGSFLHQRYRRRKKWELMEANYKLEQSEHELAKAKVNQQELELKNVQQKLEHSRKETTDIAVFMQSRDELLDKLRDQIKQGYKMEGSELLSHLKKINAFIKQYQMGNNVDSSIIQVIDEKNKEFVEKLMERHPNLTPGEKHLALLLRVNFSTKDVAVLTGTTPKTINMNRYRLRKSLGLDGDTDLIAYLQSI